MYKWRFSQRTDLALESTDSRALFHALALYLYSYDNLGRLVSYDKHNIAGNVILASTQECAGNSRLTKNTWRFVTPGPYSATRTYNTNGPLNSFDVDSVVDQEYAYDSLGRLSQVDSEIMVARRDYTYRSGKVTNQVEIFNYTDMYGGFPFCYYYDRLGNISSYSNPGSFAVYYTYDAQGQLLTATNRAEDNSYDYTYTYDGAGNILSVSDGAATHSYTYGDGNWADLLTAYDGHTIQYDGAGNPTSYYNGTNWTFSWINGRHLDSATSSSTEITFTYSADGLRKSKDVDGTVYTYYYIGEQM